MEMTAEEKDKERPLTMKDEFLFRNVSMTKERKVYATSQTLQEVICKQLQKKRIW